MAPRKPRSPSRATKGATSQRRTPIKAITHPYSRRRNIPTADLESIVADEQRAPVPLLYPRDRARDPQLVWDGKDIENQTSLSVAALPIYVQEKISPLALIEELRAGKTAERDRQLNLFGDFDGLRFEEMVQFY